MHLCNLISFYSTILFLKIVHGVCLWLHMTLIAHINPCFFLKLQEDFDSTVYQKDKRHVDCGNSKESAPTKQA